MLLAGYATAQTPESPSAPPASIEVIYIPEVLFYSVEEGGQGRFRTSERDDYTFPTSEQDYARVAALLAPLRDEGLACPQSTTGPPGRLRWSSGGRVERDVPLAANCNGPEFSERTRHTNQAFRLVLEMAESHPRPGHTPLPAPAEIKLVWLTWGNVREEWTIPAGGQARWREPDQGEKAFAVSKTDFDRIRDQFRAFEGVDFRCDRVVADMPYGRVVWAQPGFPDQTLEFDLGCVTGDATEVLQKVEAATALLEEMRDRGR